MTIEVADRLVKLRKKHGYSQEELADKLGLSRQAVSKWERAEASPDTDNLICLAKLYGVSLDELLATDEDIDTIVDEQVKDEQKEDKKEYKTESGDRVVIDGNGIVAEDADGSKVIINKKGIHTYDAKTGEVKNKTPKQHDKVMALIGGIEGVLFLLAIAAYFLLGMLLHMWGSAWCVVFIPEIISSLARAIRKKNAQQFNISFLSCFAFFFVCMVLPDPAIAILNQQLWNPMWIVFLAIPIYHSAVGTINKALDKNTDNVIEVNVDEEKEDDDEEDDD